MKSHGIGVKEPALRHATSLPVGVRSPAVDQERMKPGHWIASVLRAPLCFDIAGPHETCAMYPQSSRPEQVDNENQWGRG